MSLIGTVLSMKTSMDDGYENIINGAIVGAMFGYAFALIFSALRKTH